MINSLVGRGGSVLAFSAVLLASCGGDSTAPVIPDLDDVPDSHVVLLSSFDNENNGNGTLNFTSFGEWEVIDGCVDLHGNGFYDVWPNNGLYIDLDGTCMAGGTIETREDIVLAPGLYVLEFWLAGNNRIPDPDTVYVQFGSLHSEAIVMQQKDPFRHFARELMVTEATAARLSFRNSGGDDSGALLDLVRVRAVD